VKNLVKDSSKFNQNSLILPVLKMINNGLIPADIAKALKISPPLISYYISKAKKLGYIKQVFRDVFRAYELTQPGKRFLDQYEKSNTSPWLLCRAENIQFRAEIVQMPKIPVDWKKIQMHNWVQYKSRIDEVRVKINMGKNPTIEFLPSPVEGDDPFELFVIMVVECTNVILELNDKMGLEVGPLQLGSRGEWLIYDPVARAFCKANGQVTYEDIAKVNASKPNSIGEIEFFDPRDLLAYISMPSLVERTDRRTERIESMMEKWVQNNEFKKTHNQLTYFTTFTTVFFSAYEPLLIF
jgi:hypothetical protein